jgi:hypothetical protein
MCSEKIAKLCGCSAPFFKSERRSWGKALATILGSTMLLLLPISAWSAQKQINIASEANAPWCPTLAYGWNCETFPTGKLVKNGVTFEISNKSNNGWFAWVANGGSGTATVTIPVNVKDVKTVYTLMATQWGTTATGLLSITFTGSGGAVWTYDLTGGIDIRDYNNDDNTNSIDCALPDTITSKKGSAGTVSAWNNGQGQRLDMQIFELPTSFAGQTLESITITDKGDSGVQRSFIGALTVSTTAP